MDLKKWNSTIDRIAKELHEGKLDPNDLDQELIQKTADELAEAQGLGWGKDIEKIDYKSTDWETNRKLRANLYKFSGAKTWQELKDMHFYLYDENGEIRSFPDFKKDVLKVHQAYNVNHLDAEYSTALKSAQHAKDWQGYQNDKEVYPNLRYLTVGDDRVRDAHAALDEVVKPIDDKFWDEFYPPNGWRCRCYVEPTEDETTGDDSENIIIKPSFLNNVGKTQKIFNSKHPYFIVPVDDRSLVLAAFDKMMDADDFYLKVKSYKNGGKLDIHPLMNEAGNIEAGRLLALKGHHVKLRPEIRNSGKQPDAWLNDDLADFKRPEGYRGINSLMESANKQKAHTAIFVLSDAMNSKYNIYRNFKGALNPKINKSIEKLIIIRGTKVIEIDRNTIYDNTDPLRILIDKLFK